MVHLAGALAAYAPKVCREQKGMLRIAATHRARSYTRKNMVPCEECECKSDGQCVPSGSPEINLIEMVNGYLRQLVFDVVHTGKAKWTRSVEHNMGVVEEQIRVISRKKSYLRKVFDSQDRRLEDIKLRGGEITPL